MSFEVGQEVAVCGWNGADLLLYVGKIDKIMDGRGPLAIMPRMGRLDEKSALPRFVGLR